MSPKKSRLLFISIQEIIHTVAMDSPKSNSDSSTEELYEAAIFNTNTLLPLLFENDQGLSDPEMQRNKWDYLLIKKSAQLSNFWQQVLLQIPWTISTEWRNSPLYVKDRFDRTHLEFRLTEYDKVIRKRLKSKIKYKSQ